jgi:hypothetical protein
MTTMKIGTPNWLEPLWAAFSLGAWATANPAANLADSDFANPAISTNAAAASTQVGIDLSAVVAAIGSTPGADCLTLPKHNLTQSATIHVKAGTAAFTSLGGGGGTILYDSGVIPALPAIIYPSGMLPWGHIGTWTGAPDPVIDGAYNRPVLVQFGATIVATFWWIGIVDTANPDGVVSLARAFLGPFWQPAHNFDYGVTIEPQGTRVAVEGSDNAEFIDPTRRLKRVVTFSFTDLPEAEATAVWLPLMMYLGYAKQAVFLYDPGDALLGPRRNFMVTVQKPGAIAYATFQAGTVPLVLQEVI